MSVELVTYTRPYVDHNTLCRPSKCYLLLCVHMDTYMYIYVRLSRQGAALWGVGPEGCTLSMRMELRSKQYSMFSSHSYDPIQRISTCLALGLLSSSSV